MNKITNLVESLKMIGFKTDHFGNLSLTLPNYLAFASKASCVQIAVMDFDTGELPTEETTHICIAVQTQTENDEDIDSFQIIKEIENV